MNPHATGLDPAQVLSLVNSIHSLFSYPASNSPESIANADSGDPQLESGAFLEAVQAHRVATLVDDCSGALGLAEPVAQQLHALAINDALLAMTLAKETVKAWSLLDSAGVSALAFKGVALSVQTTGTVTARGNGDVDLLVQPVDVLRAVKVLTAGGWQLAE
ncbi:MAG: nucleotidyltransferase family protein, partial [Gammaproteobacteria bacterium]|nr:nucleotidyltransferase family protein [Gammaproteobacteria bacterium]